MSSKQHTWIYPGFNSPEELVKSGYRFSHYLFMYLSLRNHFKENGNDEFLEKQTQIYQEYFFRHKKHFEMIIQHFGCQDEKHEFFMRWDALIAQIHQIAEQTHPGDDDYYQSIDQENDAYFKLRQIIKDHQGDNTILRQIKFIVQNPEGFSKTIAIGDESALFEILASLESLPEGKPLTRMRGRRKLGNQNEFYKRIISGCFEFANTNYKQDLTLTDRLFFTALTLSVVYLDFESPLTYDGSLQDYKDAVSDQLKYYL